MRKYKLKELIAGIVFLIIWCIMVSIMIAVMSDQAPGIYILMPVGFFLFGVLLLISNITKLMTTAQVTRNGKKGQGKILRGISLNTRTNHKYRVTFEFDDSNGVKRKAVDYLYILPYMNYSNLKTVPILIYGKKAIIDLDTFTGVTSDRVYNNEDFTSICECGNIVKPGLLYCPKCGRHVKMCENEYHNHHNFCPSCNTKVDDSNFCPNCGYRLK